MPTGVGVHRLGGSETLDGLTHIDRFNLFVFDPTRYTLIPTVRAANPTAKILMYCTAADMQDLAIGAANPTTNQQRLSNYGGVSYNESLLHDQTAASNDKWVLRDSGGNPLSFYGYGFYTGDVGLQSFRDRWWSIILDKMTFLGFDGVHLDNLLAQSGSPFSSKYPTDAAWEEAMYAFAVDIGGRMKAAGKYCLCNAAKVIPSPRPGSENTDSGLNTKNWWTRVAPYVNGLECEYWAQFAGDVTHRRLSQFGYMDNFDNWVTLPTAAESGGADVVGHTVSDTYDTQMALYGRASLLLTWSGVNPQSSFVWNYQLQADVYNARAHVDIGTPTGPYSKPQTNLWLRYFTNGVVVLNSDPTNAKTINALDGRPYQYGDAVAANLPITLQPGTAAVLYTPQGSGPVSPPPTDGTFGRTTIGSTFYQDNPGLLAVHKYTAPANGSLTKLTAYLQGLAGTDVQTIKAVVYSDSGGNPAAKLAEGSDVTVQAGQAAGWVDLPLASALTIAEATPYWIGYIAGPATSGTTIQIAKDLTGGIRQYRLNRTYASPDNPFGTADAADTAQPSLYATYTATVAPSTKAGVQTIGSLSTLLLADTKQASKVTIPTAAKIPSIAAYLAGGSGPGASGTFGKNTIGTEEIFVFADEIKVTSFALGVAGTVSKLTAYLHNLSGTLSQQMRGVIYADNGAGAPGALVAVTNGITLAAGATAAWVDLVFASGVPLAAGTYWIGVHGGPADTTGALSRAAGGVTAHRFGTSYSINWDPFGTPDTTDANQSSVYATYSTATAGTQNAKAVVYADNNGVPGAKMGESAEVAIPSAQAAGWQLFTFATPIAVQAGPLWIGLHVGTADQIIRAYEELTGGITYQNADTYSDGAASPFGSGVSGVRARSIYANLTLQIANRPPGPRKTRSRSKAGWPTL